MYSKDVMLLYWVITNIAPYRALSRHPSRQDLRCKTGQNSYRIYMSINFPLRFIFIVLCIKQDMFAMI